MQKHFADEESIIWLRETASLKYVREAVVSSRYRKKRPGYCGAGELVGYATIRNDVSASSGLFTRRIFLLMDHDWPNDGPYKESGGFPCEAVAPASVKAGVPGASPVQ
jgi:hypothetical protein